MPRTTIVFAAPWDSDRLFAPIRSHLSADIDPVFTEMLVADPANLVGWSFDSEIAALDAKLSAASPETPPHLVAYSGAAAVSIGVLAGRPDAVSSATLMEPPWIGNDEWSGAEREFRAAFAELPAADTDDAWRVICAALNAPGTPLPPSPPMPPEMLKAGFVHIWNAYMNQSLDRARLAEVDKPVLLPIGESSATRMHAQAELLSEIMPDARSLKISGAAHFDLPLTGAAEVGRSIAAMASATEPV